MNNDKKQRIGDALFFLGIVGLVVVTIGLVAMTLAQAQTTPTAGTTTAPDAKAVAESLAPKVDIKLKPITLTAVPVNTPTAIDLSSIVVPGVPSSLTQGVTAKAYTRYVDFEGKKVAQVVLVGVEKNGKVEKLPSESFAGQFDLKVPELDPAQDVIVQGDSATIRAALERLAQAPTQDPQQQQQDQVVQKDTQNAPQQNSAPAQQNDPAASWTAPDPVQVAEAPQEAMRLTTSGCTIRIDVGQMRAIQQSRTETTKGGAVVSEGTCSDSEQGFDLQRSYAVCADQVDLDPSVRTATAQYLLFYTDAGGARQEVTECAPDAEKVFTIVEKPEACTIFLDYTAMKAVPQSALVYQNDNNVEVQVRGCQASETKAAVDLTATTDGCSIRHDFSAGKSMQQGTHVYLMDGIQYQAGGCADNGTEYVHTKVYEDAVGNYVCTPITDFGSGTVTLQSRLKITVGGIDQFISECTPDTTGQMALVATTTGCTNPATWTHDLAAGQSYGQERYYYVRNGVTKYVTDCQNSAAVYTHQTETTGWQNHDDQLFAYPLSTVYIVPPAGRYDIAVSQVLSGATQMPYQLTGTDTRPNGNVTYNGCDRYSETSLMELWKRPDNTVYEKPVGPGAVVGPVNICLEVVKRSGQLGTGTTTSNTCSYGNAYVTVTSYTGYVEQVTQVNQDTGATAATTCRWFGGSWVNASTSVGPTHQNNAGCNVGSWTTRSYTEVDVGTCPTGMTFN